MAASLMTLPSEVRLLVFSLLLHTSPASSCRDRTGDTDEWTEADDISYVSWTRSQNLVYPTGREHYRSGVSGLLLANRQCHHELKGLIKSLCKSHDKYDLVTTAYSDQELPKWRHGRRSPLDYHDSTMCVSSVTYEMELCATTSGEWQVRWVDVPFKAAWVRQLHVRLRNVVSSPGERPRPGVTRAARMWAEQLPYELPSLGCIVWSLLERYVKVGVQHPRPKYSSVPAGDAAPWSDDVDVAFAVGEVIFHVDLPDPGCPAAPSTVPETADPDISFTDLVKQMADRPLYSPTPTELFGQLESQLNNFTFFLCVDIDKLIDGEIRGRSRESIFNDCIGRLEVRVNGESVRTWQIGNRWNLLLRLQDTYDPLL